MKRLRILGGAAALTALALGGGTFAAASPADSEPGPAGELLATWSEEDHDLDELREVVPAGTHVAISSEDERIALVIAIDPWAIPAADVVDADLSTGMLIVGAYHRCTEQGLVLAQGDKLGVIFEAVAEEHAPDCDWAPYTVEVWHLPFEADAPEASELGRVVVGDLLVSWSEQEHQGADLPDLGDHPDGLVLRTEADRDAWLAGLSDQLDSSEVAAADLYGGALVVGGYHRCDAVGVVVADDDRAWFTTWVPDPFVCAWAPYTVEVWFVVDDELPGVRTTGPEVRCYPPATAGMMLTVWPSGTGVSRPSR